MKDTPRGPGEDLRSMATQTLVDHAARGNEEAARAIYERLRPRLVRWTHGRLPHFARDLNGTDDLVQDAIVRSLSNLEGFQQQGGGLLSYLCTSVINLVRNDIRRVKRRPEHSEFEDVIPAKDRSPIERVIDIQSEERYRRALSKLSAEDQDLVDGRIELEMSFQELALHTGKPSTDAARMGFNRAILKLAETLAEDDPRT